MNFNCINKRFVYHCKTVFYGMFVKLNERIDQIIFILYFQFVTLILLKNAAKLECLSQICNSLDI